MDAAGILRRYAEGQKVKAMADDLGISVATIYDVLKANGVKANRNDGTDAATQAELCGRYLNGETSIELAAQFGMSSTTVLNVLKKHGVPLRRDRKLREGVRHANRKLSDKQELEIARRYTDGERSGALAAEFGVCPNTVTIIVRRHGHAVRAVGGGWYSAPEHMRKAACARYVAGESALDICNDIGIKRTTLYAWLEGHGIARQSPSERSRRYPCNEGFFDRIDNEEAAYWLGFIAADGCVVKGRVLAIALAEKDRGHLERFKAAISSDKPIYESTSKTFGGSFPSVRLDIASKPMHDALVHHGIHPRKSLTHQWPDFLSGDLLRHYFRGYFDGDGGFTKPINNPYWYAAFVVGSRPFLEGCRAFLRDEAGLAPNKIRRDRAKNKISKIQYGGRRCVQTFARFLYHDATVWLPRKREKVEHLLIPDLSGNEVKKLRIERGWSQGQLAAIIGVGRSAISRIEDGTRTPRPTTVAALRKVLL